MAARKPLEPQICEQIITMVSQGLTVPAACKILGAEMGRFYVALTFDQETAQNYARAQRQRADAHFERIAEIAEEVLQGELDPQAARVAIDAWKWTAARQCPKKYGDKIQIEDTTPKPALSREELLQQLSASGLRVADVFGALTKPAERAEPVRALEVEGKAEQEATQPRKSAAESVDLGE